MIQSSTSTFNWNSYFPPHFDQNILLLQSNLHFATLKRAERTRLARRHLGNCHRQIVYSTQRFIIIFIAFCKDQEKALTDCFSFLRWSLKFYKAINHQIVWRVRQVGFSYNSLSGNALYSHLFQNSVAQSKQKLRRIFLIFFSEFLPKLCK
jgi:hypothetical protein